MVEWWSGLIVQTCTASSGRRSVVSVRETEVFRFGDEVVGMRSPALAVFVSAVRLSLAGRFSNIVELFDVDVADEACVLSIRSTR